MRAILALTCLIPLAVPTVAAEEGLTIECVENRWETFDKNDLAAWGARDLLGRVYLWFARDTGGSQQPHMLEVIEENGSKVSGYLQIVRCAKDCDLDTISVAADEWIRCINGTG